MSAFPLPRPTGTPWSDPPSYWGGLSRATAALDPPLGVIELTALAHNAHSMLDRAGGRPIRVATKSVRVRSVVDAVLALPGYAGALAYTLPEALWLAETIDDVVVAYPTVDRSAIAALGSSPELAARVTIMVDSIAHLDVVDAVLPPGRREVIRVCLELDASLRSRALGHVGVQRSPVHSPADAARLAEHIQGRPGFTLVGVMSYEAQIAGLTNDRPGQPFQSRLVRGVQARSGRELLERRAAAVAAVRRVADLAFVNGGGTGSLEFTAADPSVTELAAGSGLFGPHLFDGYRHFQPAPAAAFALPVVRKPRADVAVLLGGGWIASGPTGADRSPAPVWPPGLRYVPREGAGEVQSPLRGPAARQLGAGDRVWLRHTKAGELSEHLDAFVLVDGDRIVDSVATYRGEGRVFL